MGNSETVSFSTTTEKAHAIKRFVYTKDINRSWYLDFLTTYALENVTPKELEAAIASDPRSKIVPGGARKKH